MGYTRTYYRPPGMLHRNLDESEDPSTWIKPVTTRHDDQGKVVENEKPVEPNLSNPG